MFGKLIQTMKEQVYSGMAEEAKKQEAKVSSGSSNKSIAGIYRGIQSQPVVNYNEFVDTPRDSEGQELDKLNEQFDNEALEDMEKMADRNLNYSQSLEDELEVID